MPVWLATALSLLKGAWDFLAKLGPLLASYVAGKRGEELKDDDATINAVREREKLREDISRADDDERDRRMLKWTRKD